MTKNPYISLILSFLFFSLAACGASTSTTAPPPSPNPAKLSYIKYEAYNRHGGNIASDIYSCDGFVYKRFSSAKARPNYKAWFGSDLFKETEDILKKFELFKQGNLELFDPKENEEGVVLIFYKGSSVLTVSYHTRGEVTKPGYEQLVNNVIMMATRASDPKVSKSIYENIIYEC